MSVRAGKQCRATLESLLTRRSILVEDLRAPGPDAGQLADILSAASRVPDHGKVCPFYFLVFEGEARLRAGDVIAEAYGVAHPDCEEGKIEKERLRFMRAPLVVGIIFRARESKNPLWEQMMSVGAAAQNFSLACHAHGFGVQWLSEWVAYDEHVRRGLGLDARDVVAGFMYVGTCVDQPEERDRPDLNLIVNDWEEGVALKKGDVYGRVKFGFPPNFLFGLR